MILEPPILHLFGRQHGVASHLQLREHLGARQLRRASELGLLLPELPMVKRLAGAPTSTASRIHALSRYVGDTGFVSGMTSAWAYGVTAAPREYFEVMVPDSRAPELPNWARPTRSSWRLVSDRRELADGRTVASPLRTLFRCGATCSDVRFEKIAEQLWRLELITPAEAATYLQSVRRSGRHGVARFERWLERAIERPLPSGSGLEVDLAAALRNVGLPEPVRQHPLLLRSGETIHVDLAYLPARLGVEPGATWWHGGDLRARRDDGRDRACDEIGWRILRFDEVELRDMPRCARQVAAIHRTRLQQFAGQSAL